MLLLPCPRLIDRPPPPPQLGPQSTEPEGPRARLPSQQVAAPARPPRGRGAATCDAFLINLAIVSIGRELICKLGESLERNSKSGPAAERDFALRASAAKSRLAANCQEQSASRILLRWLHSLASWAPDSDTRF